MKLSRQRKLWALALVLLGGLYVGDHLFLQRRGIASFEGHSVDSERPVQFDLTDLPEKEFYKAFKHTLVQGLELKKEGGHLGLSWGQFLVKNPEGAKVYACERYPNFEMTLKAEGIAYSGNTPTLTVRGPCQSSDDGKNIMAFMIPLRDLHKNLRANSIYRVPIGNRGDSFIISAQYLYNEWPQYWNVTEVKLYNETETLSIDGYEIISLLDQALTLDFADVQ